MNIKNQLETRIIKKEKPGKYSILNINENIEEKLKKHVGENKTFEQAQIIIEETGTIIDKTIEYNINVGNINSRFEKEFRQFLARIIDVDIF